MTSSAPATGDAGSGIVVVVPAHNEEAVIQRGLRALLRAQVPGLRVLVVANGCTDRTVERAKGLGDPRVSVHDLAESGKARAVKAGLALAGSAAVVAVVDADVELDETVLPGLVDVLDVPAPAIAAPTLRLDTAACSVVVRRYFRVWADEPHTRDADIAGRGIYAVNAAGAGRLDRMPEIMADDAWARAMFAPHERIISPGTSLVRPARTLRAQIRRRGRVLAGNRELRRVLPLADRPKPRADYQPVTHRGARDRVAAHGLLDVLAWYGIELPARVLDAWWERRGAQVSWGTDTTTR